MVARIGSNLPTPPPKDDSIMELSLMMSRRQFEALEQRATMEGLSVGKFLRRLVRESIDDEASLDCSN